jgi:hypothetical protein
MTLTRDESGFTVFMSTHLPRKIQKHVGLIDKDGDQILFAKLPRVFARRQCSGNSQLSEAISEFRVKMKNIFNDILSSHIPMNHRNQCKFHLRFESLLIALYMWLQHYHDLGLIRNSRRIQHFKIARGFLWVSPSTTYQPQPYNSSMWGQNNEISTLFHFAKAMPLSDINTEDEHTMEERNEMAYAIRQIYRGTGLVINEGRPQSTSSSDGASSNDTTGAMDDTISPMTQDNKDFQDEGFNR